MPGTKGGMVYHWKHGYIPLDHAAALKKAHGSKTGAAKIMQKHNIGDGHSEGHAKRLAETKPSTPTGPVGKDHRDMSSAEKIRAAEIMHGTGSKQHLAAQAKFGGKRESAKPDGHAKVRDMPAGDTFKGVHSETHMGERISVRKGKQWGTIETSINGHTVGVMHGTKNGDAVKHLDSTKGTVAHAKANPANYTNGAGESSYGMKLGKTTSPAKSPKRPTSPTGSAMRDARLKYGAGSHEHLAAIAADRLASKKK